MRLASCMALPDCPCGMSGVFRCATDDYLDNSKKHLYPTSLIKAWSYFSCSTLSFSIQPAGSNSQGYRSQCSAGNKSIFINGVDWLEGKVKQYEQTGDTADIDEMFAQPNSIGRLTTVAASS